MSIINPSFSPDKEGSSKNVEDDSSDPSLTDDEDELEGWDSSDDDLGLELDIDKLNASKADCTGDVYRYGM